MIIATIEKLIFYRSRGGLFLKTRLDQLRQPGDIGNDKCAVSAFDQTSAGQRAQFARYRLTVGADAASDVGMGWFTGVMTAVSPSSPWSRASRSNSL